MDPDLYVCRQLKGGEREREREKQRERDRERATISYNLAGSVLQNYYKQLE